MYGICESDRDRVVVGALVDEWLSDSSGEVGVSGCASGANGDV